MSGRRTNLFTQVPVQKLPRNLFDLSNEVKTTGKFGDLYPFFLQDCLPGDTWRNQSTVFCRFAPMKFPLYHRCDVYTYFFFVPDRILFTGFENFITGGQTGNDGTIPPFVTPAGIRAQAGNSNLMKKRTMWDHMGLPVLEGADPAVFEGEQISAAPFKAQCKVWNDWFRDPNLDNEVDIDVEVAGDVSSSFVLKNWGVIRQVGWERDYYTAALPFAQRGNQVLLPLTGNAVVTYKNVTQIRDSATGMPADGALNAVGGDLNYFDATDIPARVENIDSLALNATSTINDFRRAMAIQRWLENNARGGGRYIEQIQAHWNVRVPDFRLQRSEYIGGGKQPVRISEVLATAETEDVPVGDLFGHGISAGKSNRFTYRAQEHGWIIGFWCIKPRTSYSQGIDRKWLRGDKFDFAQPELANLGEQEIRSREVFFSFDNADHADNVEIFGYLPRYAEYKFALDKIHGDFHDSLEFAHLSRIFTSRPVLDSTFVTMLENNTATEVTSRRIFAVQDGTDYLWLQIFNRCTAKRQLPYFGVPNIT